MSFTFCPICGASVPDGMRLVALPPGYGLADSPPQHRCDPKRLAAIDRRRGSEYDPYTRERTEAERLAEGFRSMGDG